MPLVESQFQRALRSRVDPRPDPYADDPVGFATDVLGFRPWSKQQELMWSVAEHDKTAVRSSHGVGKTAAAAQVVLWFLATRRNSRVITTAPTWAQVEGLLWREIRAQVGRAHGLGKASMFPAPLSARLELGEQWLALGLSTNEPERFQGHHADHLLLVVDEASGVDERIFEAAEGFLTAEGAKVLLIGNPTRVGGQFHRCFTSERARWNQLHISVFDSPNYTGETVTDDVRRAMPHAGWAREVAEAWGEGSPMYEVRALGNFPSSGEDNVISLHAVEQARARVLEAGEPRVLGCDVARFGSDETVIAARLGNRARLLESYVGRDTTHTAGRLAEWARELDTERIVVDDAGVGGGVTDQLRAEGFTVDAFQAAGKARRPEQFPNRRSEIWFEAAEQIDQLDIDEDEQLAADLTGPRYSFDLKLRRVVEKKDETKRRLGRSPDRADALLLTLTGPSAATLEVPQGMVDRGREGVSRPVNRGFPLGGGLGGGRIPLRTARERT